MRAFIVALGMMVAVAAALMARMALERVDGKKIRVSRVEADINDHRRILAALREWPRREPLALDLAYTGLVNDLDVLSRVHGVSWRLDVQGTGEKDVVRRAVPSQIEGVREIPVKAVYSGFARETAIVALLDGFNALQRTLPVIVRRVFYEKGVLAVDLTVFGP